MVSNFAEWMQRRDERMNESFTTLSQKPGDMVYFGAHDILRMSDDQPLDPSMVGPKMSAINSIGPKGVMVDAPHRHGFRQSSVKKFMGKGGNWTIPSDHLSEISPDMVKGGVGQDTDGNPKRLYIFTPNTYTKEMLMKKNRRMMKADAPAAVPEPVAQPQLPAPVPAEPQTPWGKYNLPAINPTDLLDTSEHYRYY